MPIGLARKLLDVQLGGSHGTEQAADLQRGQVGLDIGASDLEQRRQLGHEGRIGQFAEDFVEHQLLPLHAAKIAEAIVAEAQKAREILALKQLPAGVEINGQSLGLVGVEHALRHIHIDATKGIAKMLNGVEINEDVVVNGR